MKHYYQAELEASVERFKASMAAAQRLVVDEPRVEHKGQTLLVVRGERNELRRY